MSFLGGIWWGLAAARVELAPEWLWLAAVAPSLYSVGTLLVLPFDADARTALFLLSAALPFTLLVDRELVAIGLAPPWWLRLRAPLSLGLALLTALLAWLG